MMSGSSAEAMVMERLVDPTRSDFDRASAEALLRLRPAEQDVVRIRDLLALQKSGTASQEELAELEAYDRVGTLISLLQSKARLALAKPGSGGRP